MSGSKSTTKSKMDLTYRALYFGDEDCHEYQNVGAVECRPKYELKEEFEVLLAHNPANPRTTKHQHSIA